MMLDFFNCFQYEKRSQIVLINTLLFVLSFFLNIWCSDNKIVQKKGINLVIEELKQRLIAKKTSVKKI